MRWQDTLTKEELSRLDKLDSEIAVLRMTRYKMQNAANKRVEREKDGKKKRGGRKAKAKSRSRAAGQSATA